MSMWGRVSDPPMPSESSAFLLPLKPLPNFDKSGPICDFSSALETRNRSSP